MSEKDSRTVKRYSPVSPPHKKPKDLKGATHRLKAYALKKYRQKLKQRAANEYESQKVKLVPDTPGASLTPSSSINSCLTDGMPTKSDEDFVKHESNRDDLQNLYSKENNDEISGSPISGLLSLADSKIPRDQDDHLRTGIKTSSLMLQCGHIHII